MKPILFLYTLYILILFPGNTTAADITVFQLKPMKETVLLLGGLTIQQVGDQCISRTDGPNLNSLDKSDLSAIDQFACKYYSKKLSHISDTTKDAITALMFLETVTLLRKIHKENIQAFITDLILYIESESMIIGMTKCSKGLAKRPRPYAYNTNLPREKREGKNASLSFWSGHASLAFSTAVFTGYVFQNRHPGSPFIIPVWICGISCATATSILRVRSGNHFPTDVLAGAAVGAFTGWLIPRMHRENNHSFSFYIDLNGENRLGVNFFF